MVGVVAVDVHDELDLARSASAVVLPISRVISARQLVAALGVELGDPVDQARRARRPACVPQLRYAACGARDRRVDLGVGRGRVLALGLAGGGVDDLVLDAHVHSSAYPASTPGRR